MEEYPIKIVLSDKTEADIKEIEDEDIGLVTEFLEKVPLSDTVIYRDDVCEQENPMEWFVDDSKKKLFQIISIVDGDVTGIGTLHKEGIYWHNSAELKIIVIPKYRGKGLGSVMFNLLLQHGLKLKIQKIIVRYLADNKNFMNILRHYDFQPESLLNQYILDDKKHHKDLIIASFNLDEWSRRFEYYSFYFNLQLK